jgi:hypothetical protein
VPQAGSRMRSLQRRAVEGNDLGEGLGILARGFAAETGGFGSAFLGLCGGSGSELGIALGLELVGLDFDLVGLFVEGGGGDADGVPFVAERADDRRADEALDVGAWRIFGPELVALAGIKGTGEEGAEDGWLDGAPIGSGRHR